MKKVKLTIVSSLHYVRLVYRAALFLATLVIYIYNRVHGLGTMLSSIETRFPIILGIVWVVFMFEMVSRFFPSKTESPGCQKQFRENYVPTGRIDVKLHDNNAVMIVALVWIAFNGLFGALYITGIVDEDIMLLLSLAYSVCDMICILFFCPFQTWFLKNKCCSACRIYNWDYAMMFTPFFFVARTYTWSLLIAAMAIMIRWEITILKYPERFSENTNAYLHCENCTEKLCVHKKQLIVLRRQIERLAAESVKRIKGSQKES